jgi:hypothetical protein
LGFRFEVEDGLFELSAPVVRGFERIILEDFFADFIPHGGRNPSTAPVHNEKPEPQQLTDRGFD